MKRIIGNIYEETDYSVFKALPENRAVLKNRVEKLIASMSQKYLLNPIMVNEKMEVVDGQGRFEARRAMGKPIHYYICKGANSNDCRLLNKYNSNWKALDFVKSFSDSGNENYTRLLSVIETERISARIALRLANKTDKAGGDKQPGFLTPFERGELVFTTEDQATVMRVMRIARDIRDALAYTKTATETYYRAVKVMCECNGYNHERMLRNCAKQRHNYYAMSDITSQLKEFERIYNYEARKNKLYFSDFMRHFNVDSEALSEKVRKKDLGESVSTLNR